MMLQPNMRRQGGSSKLCRYCKEMNDESEVQAVPELVREDLVGAC